MALVFNGWRDHRIQPTSVVAEASLCELYDLSSSVKGLKLKVDSLGFSFKAGQWVDLYVPGIKEIGGYSICSTPQLLREEGVFELAIKQSSFPPTQWVCTQSKVGSRVKVCVGGDFYFDPQPPGPPRDLLLVAGGVGINPLLSIMRHACALPAQCRPGRMVLAFSAPTLNDLIFRNEITRLVSDHSSMAVRFFVTRSKHTMAPLLQPGSHPRIRLDGDIRIGRCQLSEVLKSYFSDDVSNLDSYICGPSGLIDDTNETLLSLGLTPAQIKYEKWW